MKKAVLFFSLLFVSFISLAQDKDGNDDQKQIIYKVTSYIRNGTNYDHLALEKDIALVFYECNAGEFCMSNFWRKNDTQSYGGVYSLRVNEIPETEERYAADKYTFTWNFVNSYDDITGQARVTFFKIYLENMVKFTADINVIDTNSHIRLEGYLESYPEN